MSFRYSTLHSEIEWRENMGWFLKVVGLLIISVGAITMVFGLSGTGRIDLLLLGAVTVGGPWILGGILIAAFGQLLLEIKAVRVATERQVAVLSGAKV